MKQKMSGEQLAEAYIAGTVPVPEQLEGLVSRYLELRDLIDELESYPRWIDGQMNACFDKILEHAGREEA